jgi:hypothetical protein
MQIVADKRDSYTRITRVPPLIAFAFFFLYRSTYFNMSSASFATLSFGRVTKGYSRNLPLTFIWDEAMRYLGRYLVTG